MSGAASPIRSQEQTTRNPPAIVHAAVKMHFHSNQTASGLSHLLLLIVDLPCCKQQLGGT